MKTLFILLPLFALSNPVLAESSDSHNDLKDSDSDNIENRQLQPDPGYFGEPQLLKLIQTIYDEPQTITVEAGLTLKKSQPIV